MGVYTYLETLVERLPGIYKSSDPEVHSAVCRHWDGLKARHVDMHTRLLFSGLSEVLQDRDDFLFFLVSPTGP